MFNIRDYSPVIKERRGGEQDAGARGRRAARGDPSRGGRRKLGSRRLLRAALGEMRPGGGALHPAVGAASPIHPCCREALGALSVTRAGEGGGERAHSVWICRCAP